MRKMTDIQQRASSSANISVGQQRDPAVSIIRVLAFILIFMCHIMQYYGFGLAWWFNVGVQIFLCLSGYLYGRKVIADDLSFLKKQCVKILTPYYLVILAIILIQIFFFSNQVSAMQIIKALLIYGTLKGGEHLWFIPTILFCYVLTPLINRLNEYIFNRSYVFFRVVMTLLALSVIVALFVSYFNSTWIACYYIGNVVGKNEIKNKIRKFTIKYTACFFAAGLISAQIIISYILKIQFSGFARIFYSSMCDYGHVFLGVATVILLLDFFRELQIVNLPKAITFLDSISYEGYLVHQFLILGPMSLLNFKYTKLNVLIIVMIIFLLTIIIALIIKEFEKKIKTIILKV